MKNFTKWMALVLVIIMCVGIFAGCKQPPVQTNPGTKPTEGTQPPATKPTEVKPDELVFTGAPGLPGEAADRLPVKEDVFVSQLDATGAVLEIGTYGGDINVRSGGGSWDLSRPTLETIIRRNSDGSYSEHSYDKRNTLFLHPRIWD